MIHRRRTKKLNIVIRSFLLWVMVLMLCSCDFYKGDNSYRAKAKISDVGDEHNKEADGEVSEIDGEMSETDGADKDASDGKAVDAKNTDQTGKDAGTDEASVTENAAGTDRDKGASNEGERSDGRPLAEEDTDESYVQEKDMIEYDREDAYSYISQPLCRYNRLKNTTEYDISFNKGVPKSDDYYVYLFEVASYEDETNMEGKIPVAVAAKKVDITFSLPYETRHLFSSFVPALLEEGEFVPLSYGQYIFNPEALAANCKMYPPIDSKKGLLLDANTLGSDKLADLKVKRLVYNIPLSFIMGETENDSFPTIEYEYDGKVYKFNGYKLAGFDSLFSYLTKEGYYCTAIILNDWNKSFPEIMHPKSRKRTSESMYYAFNTEEEEGARLMEAVALFLAKRYSGGEYGMVYDWVIANEINQQKIWNYMDTDDLYYYTESFEKSFRTFYNAIKSNYGNAHIYFSIDHDWNDNYGHDYKFFNGRDLLYTFNDIAKKRGDYDWALSIHPYPNPLPKVRFWKGEFDKSEEARVVTPMNLSSVTSLMTRDEFLDTNGRVRQIAVTELGFSSRAGEDLQAAAFAYCYLIIEDNEYINSFLLNRQTDDKEALKSGLALGIYNNDYSSKKIADVFTDIDSSKDKGYIEEMLKIIGAETLEEALEWAR